MSNSLGPDQDQHLSALISVQTVCKYYQQMTKVTASKNSVSGRIGNNTYFSSLEHDILN